MTNYEEEQASELEALQSIYENEFTMVRNEAPQKFLFDVTAHGNGFIENPNSSYFVSAQLQFAYTLTYPDEIPEMEIIESENLTDSHLSELNSLMHQQAEENLGMAMVFAIVSAVQEWLTELTEKLVQDDITAAEQKKQQDAEEEFAKFQGTIVTIETFLAWKRKFDAEMDEKARVSGEKKEIASKLTGKALFMIDSTMDYSDFQFFQNEGESVEVDESLFQDLDDLDLDLEEDVS